MYRHILKNLHALPKKCIIPSVCKVPLQKHYALNYFHSSQIRRKVIVSNENNFAYDVINKIQFLQPQFQRNELNNVEITDVDSFDNLLEQDWKNQTCQNILEAFKNVKDFCIKNNISLSDTRFDNLVDGLLDNCEHLTYNNIVELLTCLIEIPFCDSYESHNFHDVWSCLDDVCCWKMIEWDTDKCFTIGNLWYKLQLGRFCDYLYVLLDRLSKKADKLSKQQLVNVYFFFNVCRRRPVDFEYEFALERLINEMNVDEIAVVAMGFFKTKTKIKIPYITQVMANKVTENSKTVHEISLAAVLKAVRFSKPIKSIEEINIMLNNLIYEIPRLSCLCCLHMALIGTSIQWYHKETLQAICEKFIKNVTDVNIIRLKDIERILNVLSMFNVNPNTKPEFFKTCFDEIHKEERLNEEIKYPRSLLSTLHYFELRQMYSYELANRVLDNDYILDNFGKIPKSLPSELFSLDCSIDVECPDYKGNRLDSNHKRKAAKWLSEFAPSHDQPKKISAADSLFLNVLDTLKVIAGDDKYLLVEHVLPHFPRADIIMCKTDGKFTQPTIGLEKYQFGDIMCPPQKKNVTWYAIVIVGWNNTERASGGLLGQMLMKERQLQKVGYRPIFVFWNEFLPLDLDKKKQYILDRLK